MTEIRTALRSLWSAKLTTLAAIVTLSLCIAASTAFFSLTEALYLRELPVARPGELFVMTSGEQPYALVRYPVWQQIRDRSLLRDAFAFYSRPVDIAPAGEKQFVDALFVSGDALSVLGLQPRIGRLITASDEQPGAEPVVVISDDFWKSRFGGSSEVIGKTVRFDKQAHVIIGVTPPGFAGLSVGTAADIIVPIGTGTAGGYVAIMGRLGAGDTLEQVSARLHAEQTAIRDATNPYQASPYREDYLKERFAVVSGTYGISPFRARYGRALFMILGGVGLLMLVGCSTVSTLMLSRTLQRRREFAIRAAIGATRARLVREVLAEGLCLSVASVLLGGALSSVAATAVLQAISNQAFTVRLSVEPNLTVFGFGCALGFLVAIGVSGASAWYSTRTVTLSDARGTEEPELWGLKIANAGIAGQVAVSIVLVTMTWLLVGTLINVQSIKLGFDRDRVLIATTDLAGFGSLQAQQALFARIEESLTGLPNSDAVGLSTTMPGGQSAVTPWIDLADGTSLPQGMQGVLEHQVSSAWLQSLGIAISSGRSFRQSDRAGATPVVIVNQAFERRFLSGRPAIGSVLFKRMSPNGPRRPLEVVGVVEDAMYVRLKDAAPPTIYTVLAQSTAPSMFPLQIAIRSVNGAPAALSRSVSQALTAADPNLGYSFRTLSDQIGAYYAQERLVARVAAFFGGLAILLATIGLFAIAAATGAQRQFEMAVRVALGAKPARLFRDTFGRLTTFVVIGVIAGIPLSIAGGKFVSGLLFGISPASPQALGVSTIALFVAALAGGLLPIMRSLRIDPARLLR